VARARTGFFLALVMAAQAAGPPIPGVIPSPDHRLPDPARSDPGQCMRIVAADLPAKQTD